MRSFLEKARLKKSGKILDDFDLLIGATAISNNLTLVTRNVSDFDRLDKIIIFKIILFNNIADENIYREELVSIFCGNFW